MPPNGNVKRTNLGSGTVSGNGSATESDSTGWNGEGPYASCTEGSKIEARSGPGTSPRQQRPPSTSSAESAPSEMDEMSMSFEEQGDSARIADLEAQLQAIRDADEKLQRRVADQYLLLHKESKGAEAQMEKAQCRIVDLEGQLQAANEEVAVFQVRLEASETHSLAGFRQPFCYAAATEAKSPRSRSFSVPQACYYFNRNRSDAAAVPKAKPFTSDASIPIGYVMTATPLTSVASARCPHKTSSSSQAFSRWRKHTKAIKHVSVMETSAFSQAALFMDGIRRSPETQLSNVRSLRLVLIERRYGAINGEGLSKYNPLHDVRARQVDKTRLGARRLGARRLVEEGVRTSSADKCTTETKIPEAV